MNQSRRLVSQKHYQQASAITDRTSTYRRYIVIGRLAFFVLSYSYVYPHVTLPGPRKSTSSSMKSSLSAPYALFGPCGTSVITGHSEIINEALLYLSWVPVQSSYRPHVGRQNITSKLSQLLRHDRYSGEPYNFTRAKIVWLKKLTI